MAVLVLAAAAGLAWVLSVRGDSREGATTSRPATLDTPPSTATTQDLGQTTLPAGQSVAILIRDGAPVPPVAETRAGPGASIEWQNESAAAVALSVAIPQGGWSRTLEPGDSASLDIAGWSTGMVRYFVSSGTGTFVGYVNLTSREATNP